MLTDMFIASYDESKVMREIKFAELKEAGYDTSELKNKKSISVYDQIEN